MVNLENDEVEKIIKVLQQFNEGAEGIPGHPTGALITVLKEKLQAAKKTSPPASGVAVTQHTEKPDRTARPPDRTAVPPHEQT